MLDKAALGTLELLGRWKEEECSGVWAKVTEEAQRSPCGWIGVHRDWLEAIVGAPGTEGGETEALAPDWGQEEGATAALAVDGVVIEERRLKAFVQFETFEVSRWALMNVGRLMRNGVGVDDVWELDLIPKRIVKDVRGHQR